MLGVMQGRLSPMIDGKIQAFPTKTWKDEFYLAKECDLVCIDWIIEDDGLEENPFLTRSGLEDIRICEKETGVKVISICADYFMDKPLLRCSREQLNSRLNQLENIVTKAQSFGVKFIEIPCVDNAMINTEDEIEELINIVKRFISQCDLGQTELVFETSLLPHKFQYFLQKIGHTHVKANYDSGNSASLGFDVNEEFQLYGMDIATVHIKDRILGGTTVSLGDGNVCFKDFFKSLMKYCYQGPLILQVSRGEDDIKIIRDSIAFIDQYISRDEGMEK